MKQLIKTVYWFVLIFCIVSLLGCGGGGGGGGALSGDDGRVFRQVGQVGQRAPLSRPINQPLSIENFPIFEQFNNNMTLKQRQQREGCVPNTAFIAYYDAYNTYRDALLENKAGPEQRAILARIPPMQHKTECNEAIMVANVHDLKQHGRANEEELKGYEDPTLMVANVHDLKQHGRANEEEELIRGYELTRARMRAGHEHWLKGLPVVLQTRDQSPFIKGFPTFEQFNEGLTVLEKLKKDPNWSLPDEALIAYHKAYNSYKQKLLDSMPSESKRKAFLAKIPPPIFKKEYKDALKRNDPNTIISLHPPILKCETPKAAADELLIYFDATDRAADIAHELEDIYENKYKKWDQTPIETRGEPPEVLDCCDEKFKPEVAEVIAKRNMARNEEFNNMDRSYHFNHWVRHQTSVPPPPRFKDYCSKEYSEPIRRLYNEYTHSCRIQLVDWHQWEAFTDAAHQRGEVLSMDKHPGPPVNMEDHLAKFFTAEEKKQIDKIFIKFGTAFQKWQRTYGKQAREAFEKHLDEERSKKATQCVYDVTKGPNRGQMYQAIKNAEELVREEWPHQEQLILEEGRLRDIIRGDYAEAERREAEQREEMLRQEQQQREERLRQDASQAAAGEAEAEIKYVFGEGENFNNQVNNYLGNKLADVDDLIDNEFVGSTNSYLGEKDKFRVFALTNTGQSSSRKRQDISRGYLGYQGGETYENVDIGGGVGGIYTLSENINIGAATVNYADSPNFTADGNKNGNKVGINENLMLLFGSYSFLENKLLVSTIVGMGRVDRYDIAGHNGILDQAVREREGRTDSFHYSGNVKVYGNIRPIQDYASLLIQPYAEINLQRITGFQYTKQYNEGVTMTFNVPSCDLIKPEIGLNMFMPFSYQQINFKPTLGVGIAHEISERDLDVRTRFSDIDMDFHTVIPSGTPKSSLRIKVGGDITWKKQIKCSISYKAIKYFQNDIGNYGNNRRNDSLNVALSWAF